MAAARDSGAGRAVAVAFMVMAAALPLLITSGCDTSISGLAAENQPPTTSLWVRDTSLVENIGEGRLTSSVHAHWTGEDPDGYVAFFELRFYPEQDRGGIGPEDLWVQTTRNDTIVLLPIPPGEAQANVVFEVRAVDNEGLRDPTPARTVFPIRNTPPTARISSFDVPPDTTFSVFTIAWNASDPDGEADLARIEVSLNDSLNFVELPADIRFITLVGNVNRDDPSQSVTDARVYLGRQFQATEVTLPNLLLDADNTFYMRAVDRAGAQSALERYSWYVRAIRSEILFVNDYRSANAARVEQYHMTLLAEYMNTTVADVRGRVDLWNISDRTTGRHPLLPPNADPTLREILASYEYIYWVTTNTTNSVITNNFPFAAGVMERFFTNGGRLMMHTPISVAPDPTEVEGNPAVLILPMNDIISFPDTLRNQLRLSTGAEILPAENVPGLGEPLPAIQPTRLLTNTLPFVADGVDNIPLLEASYTYVTRVGARQGPWPGTSTVASMSADRRVGLFALPLVDDLSGVELYTGLSGDAGAPRRAVRMMLESLGFPRQ